MTEAVVVGSGPAGSTVADVLTAAGWTVVVLEKGRNHLIELEPPYELKGEFSNDELKFVFRHFLGPDPLIEPRTFRRSEADGERLFAGAVNNVPSTVGGGGPHADGKLPRFREEDFHIVSAYGPIEGADLCDWPVSYDELEPFYTEAERLIGVAGAEGENPFAPWRSAPDPMPPGPDMFGALLTAEAARSLGLHPYRAPTGINSIPYDERPACNNCGFCGEYGCPIHAKGDPVASLRRALRTRRCDLRPESYVTDILLDPSGRKAVGVRYLDAAGEAHEVRADHVILACGAFETPRLLLLNGLANSSGLVGCYLTVHFQTFVAGGFPFRLRGHRGRSVTHMHDDFVVPDVEARAAAREAGLPWIRGGTVEHGAAGGPIREALLYGPGPHHGSAMLESTLRDRLWVFTMQGEDLPQRSNRVDLDPSVVDAWGRPAGRMTYAPHRFEVTASAHYAPKLEEVLRRAGAAWTVVSTSPPLGDHAEVSPLGAAPASYHIMGTCRMGDDPATSVVDRWGAFWDVENLWCADSSVFPTATGYNPTLTIVALAIRLARTLAGTVADEPGPSAGP